MKIKVLLLSIIIVLMTILIYIFNLDNKVYILSLESKEESTYIKEYILGKHKLENYVNGFIEKKDRITELIKYINNNKKINIGNKTYTLQNSLIKADVIIIKIGDEELKYINNYNDIDEYLSDLEELFLILRKYSKEKIIYRKNSIDNKYKEYTKNKIKKLCENNNIEYLEEDKYLTKHELESLIK